MRIAEVTMFILVILLTLSVGLNVFQYTGRKVNSDPVTEIITVSDTVVRVDTIYRELTHRIEVEKPVPVATDTAKNVKTYRDTLFHEFGMIRREEVVFGELLSKNIEFDLKIPEITKTLTINTVSTQYVKQRLLFVTVGLQSDFKGVSYPVIGGQYIRKDHRMSLSYYYSPMYSQHGLVLGLGLVR